MLAVPPPYDKPAWSREDALVEIVRGRLEGLGPVVPDELARCLGLTASELAAPLAALETEGFAMRGRFTPEAKGEEWCERRLLSRFHHHTLKRLRAESNQLQRARRVCLRQQTTATRWHDKCRRCNSIAADAMPALLDQLGEDGATVHPSPKRK